MCPECRRTSHTWHFEAGKGLVIRHGFLLCLLYMSFELRVCNPTLFFMCVRSLPECAPQDAVRCCGY